MGYTVLKGSPYPLGASEKEAGLNFALFSKHATSVKLCLFTPSTKEPFAEIPLNPKINKTGFVWHICLLDLPSLQWEYGYKIDGPHGKGYFYNPKNILSDPYSKSLNTSYEWGKGALVNGEIPPLSLTILNPPFDWEGTSFPLIPMQDLVIYEMHVRGFTQDSSSRVDYPGTYQGVIEKIPYLKELGVNAVELLPVFEFNEIEYHKIDPVLQAPLKNFWGYSTINFFAPMNRYSSLKGYGESINEFKKMVRELHKNNIEVILDVVFNHTSEGDRRGPILSFKGIDNPIYYMVDSEGHYRNYTGCGNTFNCNHPVVSKLILDSLRYWVSEMHIDGFRFDLASVLTRDTSGHPLSDPALIRDISQDGILGNTKLIAEAWDAAGLYQVGSFPNNEGKWAEWNGQYRDIVRRFIKGTNDQVSAFAKALTGSEYLYGPGRAPYHSINFITAHDGFTLNDLVTYMNKYNLANGEKNQDGTSDNESWNCGFEGVTKDREILNLRKRQMRNFHLALMVSLGTPMILMGDEYAHTRNGNNNTWCQDNALNWFLWDELEEKAKFLRFYKLVIEFRKNKSCKHVRIYRIF